MTIIQYALLTDGCAERFGRGKVVPDGFVQVPDEISYDEIPVMMLSGDAWVARPVLADATIGGNVVTIPGCPAGTAIEVSGESGIMEMITAAGDVAITLPDAGAYVIDVIPPRPTLPRTYRLTIA